MKLSSKYLLRDSFFCLILSLLFLWIISFIILNLSIFNPFTGAFKDFSFLDIYYSENLEEKNPAKDIVIINIEKRNRFEIFQLIDHIEKQDPKVIGLDIIFRNKKDDYIDSILASKLQSKNIILSKAFVDEKWINNADVFYKNKNSIGYTNLNFDRTNNVIRNFEGKHTINDTIQYSLSTLIAKKFLGDKWEELEIEKKISKPIAIHYHGNMDLFLNLSYDDCMGQKDVPILKDKIVLLGYLGTPHGSNTDIEDKLFSPLNKRIAGKSPPDMFGVLIHANIIQMLINQSFFKVFPKWLIVTISLIIAYFAVAFFIVYNSKYPASYAFIKKIVQLLITVLLLWLSLWFFKNNILLKPELIIVFLVISVELIGTYKIIVKKLNTKYKWKSYLFH